MLDVIFFLLVFSNSVLINWGYSSTSKHDTLINFPCAYQSFCNVHIQSIYTGTAWLYHVKEVTISNFKISNSNDYTSMPCYWLAIGS